MAAWDEVLRFWFEEIEPASHWAKDPVFDALIEQRFGDLYQAACACELYTWRDQARGRLAEVIILDQFSRNLYRESGQAFAQDRLALALAQEAVSLGIAAQLPAKQRAFLYLPFMHSESALIHQRALELFAESGLEDNYRFELRHKEIVDRFGRYPHRNASLGRSSTEEEVRFLQQPGSSF
ncbi:MAG: hypothetical protein ACI9W6_001592 [Motiliproteus sp.]|jgi:uncharacterized protein (DUF924 family)